MREKQSYYFDYNATTPIDGDVYKEMIPYLTDYYGNPSSSYYIGRKTKDKIERIRYEISQYFNMKPEGVYFTSSGSEADNMILKGISVANKDKGKHIITTKIEHSAILNTCEFLEKQGYDITYLDVTPEGVVDIKELENAIREDTILISIMYVNNEIGTIEPIKEIAEISHKHNVIFHTDAVQAIGEIRINVEEMGIDCMSISGHKIYAPKGIGMAYIKPGIKFEPLIHGGMQEFYLRGGTENIANIVALGKAIKILDEIIDTNEEKMKELQEYTLKKINSILSGYDYILNGGFENRASNNISISFKDIDGESLLLALDLEGIYLSSGSACHSDSTEPSHVLKAIGVPEEYANGTLRISFGKYTTKKDIDFLISKIKEKIDFIKAI